MDRSDSTGERPIHLDRNKQIDAICDRFELAWDVASPPRIEEYLELLPASDRRPLLVELLASELALRRRQNAVCDRAQYAERFPQHLDVVAEVFDRHRRPDSAQATAITPERYFEIISGFRARRQLVTATTAIHDGDRALRALANPLARCMLEDPPNVDLPLEGQLWLSILRTCRRLKSLDLDGVDSVVRDLVEPFPPARQSILIDVLLGHASSQAAEARGVTRRTVTSTVRVAMQLLKQSG